MFPQAVSSRAVGKQAGAARVTPGPRQGQTRDTPGPRLLAAFGKVGNNWGFFLPGRYQVGLMRSPGGARCDLGMALVWPWLGPGMALAWPRHGLGVA